MTAPIISKRFRKLLSLTLFTSLSIASYAQDTDVSPWIEHDGILIIETENTQSNLGLWVKQTAINHYTGDGYLEFTGNTPSRGDPNSPISYNFKINKGGLYYFNLYCAKETLTLNGEVRTDVANDAYIRVEGDYGSGPNPGNSHGYDAPLSLLKSDTKFYGGSPNRFSWSYGNRLDPGGTTNKRVAIYDFKEGEEYTLVISGR